MEKISELRFLSLTEVYNLSRVLDDGGWKVVMSLIPSDPHDFSSTFKYTSEDIRLIESYGKIHSKSCTEILLDEWGSSGKVRPTLETLIEVLAKADFFRCADDIAKLLNAEAPKRPDVGPAANVNIDITNLNLTDHLDCYHVLPNGSTNDIVSVSYDVLFEITGGFDENTLVRQIGSHGQIISTGHKLGAGAFGTVYYGVLDDKEVAVKRLHTEIEGFDKQLETEVTTMANLKHPNLLPLIAYSCNSEHYCLVYKFMPNRSLEDKLADKRNCLPWKCRLEIAIGVCRGLDYLHSADPVVIHRDVKSANILLDDSMTPHLGDFGLVKQSWDQKTMRTSTVIGTSAYMAPEAFSGNISVKMDVYSLGIVLLELLTGLPAYEETRESGDLLSLVEESEVIEPLLDTGAKWVMSMALEVYEVSKKCVLRKKDRPFIHEILLYLSNLWENTSEA